MIEKRKMQNTSKFDDLFIRIIIEETKTFS